MKTNNYSSFLRRLLGLLALSLISFFAKGQSLFLEHIGGTGAYGYSGDGGPATAAQVNWVNGVAVDRYGGVYVADKGNGLVRKIDTNGIINSFAGVPAWGNGYNGDNMPATNAQLANPSGVAFDVVGNLYIADLGNSLIRKVNTSGIITSIAGNFSYTHSGDGGPATAAGFYEAYSVATDISGNIYVVEDLSNCIRMINTSGIINTIAGNSTTYGYSGDGGLATAAELARPQGVGINAAGWVFIADKDNNRVRVIKSGIITTYAGNGTSGYTGDGGPATAAEINGPSGIWVDAGGNVYITGGGTIRMINTNGIINTAGGGGSAGDCNPATATNIAPNSVTTDASGNIYFTEVFRVAKFCAPLQATISNVVNVNCGGNSAGSATITATSGSRPYRYLWSNSQTSKTATSLSAGSYSVTVTDLYGCSVTAGTTITSPPALTANITAQVNILCSGGNNGSATVTAGGGTGAYTYSWSPLGSSGATASNITAGVYTVTVTDANGCIATSSATITQPALLTATMGTPTNVLCNGGNNGSATVTAGGGTGAYTYLWSNGQTTSNTTSLSAGNYNVTVTDANGCTATASTAITEPAILTATMGTPTNVLCNGGNNGSVSVTAGGGTGTYTYLWSNAQTSSNATSLSAGVYNVTTTDANGCTATASTIITEPALLNVTAYATNAAICEGNCTDISATSSGGTLPYTYAWSIGNTTTSVNICPSSNTTYSVTVQDSNGCTSTASVSITVNGLPTVTLTAAKDSQCVTMTNDLLTGNPSGGTYSGSGVTGNNFDASVAGVGNQTIMYIYTDGNGCTNSDSIVIYVDICTGITGTAALQNEIGIYPNPNNGVFRLSADKLRGETTVEIYNTFGEKVFSQTVSIQNTTLNIDLTGQPAGVYILQLKTERGVFNKKLIKTK